MRVLIDTHIWIFMADRPKALGRRTARLLASEATDIWLSPLSIAELYKLRRLFRTSDEALTWARASLHRQPLREAVMTTQVALEAGTFSLTTGDPVDQLIVATARIMRCPLVTADEAIIASGVVETIPND